MTCSFYNVSTSFTVTLTAICCLSGFLAALENTAVLFSARKIHSLRTTARYFMTSLAVAELFSGVAGNSYFSSWLILNHAQHGTNKVLWKTETAVWIFTTTATTFNLVNVALDRYVAITLPLHYYTKMNFSRCLMLIAFAWFSAFSSASVTYALPDKHLPKLWFCGTVTAEVLPLCIISVCYFNIYKASKGNFRARRNITNAQQIAENERQRKTAYTFGIITSLFILFFMPSFVLNCIQLSNPSLYRTDEKLENCDGKVERQVWICIAVVSYFSAIVDPWVYAIRMTDFRIALKELFRSACRILTRCKSENHSKVHAKRDNKEDLQGIGEASAKEEIFDTAL